VRVFISLPLSVLFFSLIALRKAMECRSLLR